MKNTIKGNWCVRCTDPKDEKFIKLLEFLNKDKYPSKRWTGRENFYYGILNGNPIRGGWNNKLIKSLPKIEIEIVNKSIICKKDTGKIDCFKGIWEKTVEENETKNLLHKELVKEFQEGVRIEIEKYIEVREKKFTAHCESDKSLNEICRYYGAKEIIDVVFEYNKIKYSIETIYSNKNYDNETILSDKIDVDKIEIHIKTGNGVSIYMSTLSFAEYCKEKKQFWIVKQELLQKIYDFTNEFLKNN
jgi:hypothetical protein